MLALRNPLDTAEAKTNGAGVNDLFGAPRPAVSQPEAAPAPRVQRARRTVPEVAPPPPVVADQPYLVESIKAGGKKTEELKGGKKTPDPTVIKPGIKDIKTEVVR